MRIVTRGYCIRTPRLMCHWLARSFKKRNTAFPSCAPRDLEPTSPAGVSKLYFIHLVRLLKFPAGDSLGSECVAIR